MADDPNDDKGKVVSNAKPDEANEEEVQARERGWKPENEYEGAPGSWVDAGEFLRRAPLYEGLHKANRTVKKLEKMVSKLVEHNSKIEAASYDKALKDLQAQKKAAAADNDMPAVVAIDEKIEEVKEAKAAAPAAARGDADETFEDWKTENPWYEEDEDMFAYANGIGNQIEKQHPDWAPDKVLAEVAKKTKKAFEWKLKNPNREAPGKVGTPKGNGGAPKSSAKLPTYNDLSPEAQETYREWVKTPKNPHGIMEKDEFLRQYALRSGMIKEDSSSE